jgi:hypothetical protein
MGFRNVKNDAGIVIGRVWNEKKSDLGERFKVYKYSSFLDVLQGESLGKRLRREKKKDTDIAANIETLLDYGRSDGVINFDNENQRGLFLSLVPSLISEGKANRIIGAA